MNDRSVRQQVSKPRTASAVKLAILALCGITSARAAEIATGNPDLVVHWDNSIKYSTAFRVNGQSDPLRADPNQDDADRNFKKGLISNRVDVLSELEASYQGFGLRLSAAGWYDTTYNHSNANDSSPSTVNAFGIAQNHFSPATKSLDGQKVDLLDAFISGKTAVGGMPVTFRLGRHALIWGDSLFFGGNGIAAGQAPIDINKALAVPNLRFNELIRPDNQLSGQIQLTQNASVGAYYKLGWEANRLPGLGSYFAGVGPDLVMPGANMLFVPGAGTDLFFARQADLKAKKSGQGGLQLKYRPTEGDVDLGFYALQYNDRSFQVLIKPGVFTAPPLAPNQIGEYQLVYHEGVKTYGASASTSIGNINIAGELSVHRNLDLASTGQLDFSNTSNNHSLPLYAIGNSVQAQLSWIAAMGPNFIAREALWIGEIAWNRRSSISRNAGALDPNSTRDAWSMRMTYEPSYRQVLSGWDISIPAGLGYTPKGSRSSVVGGFGVENGGDVSVGVKGAYLDAWRFGLNYTHYYGALKTALVPISIANQTYGQSLKDRDFVSFTASRTF